jgi:hypothetical protein
LLEQKREFLPAGTKREANDVVMAIEWPVTEATSVGFSSESVRQRCRPRRLLRYGRHVRIARPNVEKSTASSIHVDEFFIVCKRPTPAINFLTSAKWLIFHSARTCLRLLSTIYGHFFFSSEKGEEQVWRTLLGAARIFPPLRRSVGPSFLPFNLPSVPPCPIQAHPIQSLSSGKIFVYVTKDTSRSAYTWNKIHVPNCN